MTDMSTPGKKIGDVILDVKNISLSFGGAAGYNEGRGVHPELPIHGNANDGFLPQPQNAGSARHGIVGLFGDDQRQRRRRA